MKKVMTAAALLRYLEKKKGYKKIKREFINAVGSRKNILFSAYDYSAFYAKVLKEYGSDAACEAKRAVKALPIEIVKLDGAAAEKAAEYRVKGEPENSCFAKALADGNRKSILI